MSNMQIDNVDLKLQALEEAISYPTYKEVEGAAIIEINTFNHEVISEKIKSNEKLTNLEGAKITLLLEVIKLLSDNTIKFNIELHNYIGFYWRGLPILIIKIKSDNPNQQRMMYISVKVYKDEFNGKFIDKKMSRYLFAGVGSIVALGLLLIGYSFVKGQSDQSTL